MWGLAARALIWTGTTALPWVAKKSVGAVSSVFGKKLTVGSTVALAAATSPTVWSTLDNATGNAISETLLKTPVGPALEKALEVGEWSNDQVAAVATNLIDNELEKRGRLNESDPDYERSKRMTEALGHLVTGDVIGAGTIASNAGLQTSDLVESYNQAKAQNPNGNMQEVGEMAFVYAREKARNRDLEAGSPVAGVVAAATGAAVGGYSPSAPSSSPSRDSDSLEGLSREGISSAFEAAAEMTGGFAGFMMKTVSFLSGIFGKNAQMGAQKMMLGMVDTETKLAALQQAARNGNVVSRLGDRFGVQNNLNSGYAPEQPELAT